MDILWRHQQINESIQLRTNKCKRSTKWKILMTSFIINALVPTTFCSYGIYIMYLDNDRYQVSETIWNPTIFLVSMIISKSWWQDLTEFWIENGKKSGRWWTIFGVIIAAIGIATSFITTNIFWANIISGIFGGCGVSLVMEYVKSFVNDQFQLQNPLIRVVDEAALAIGQFIIPHLTYGFIRMYAVRYAPILQSAILIQVIPSILLLKNALFSLPPIKSRYSDFQRPLALLTDQEMVVFNAVTEPKNEMTVIENSNNTTFRQWKSLPNISQENHEILPTNTQENDDKNIESLDNIIVDESSNATSNVPANVDENSPNTTRLKTPYGVEILPEIPEENEDSCSIISNNMYNKNLNRLSVISTKLDEMISRQDANDLFMQSNDNQLKNVYPIKILSPYKMYRLKKSYRCMKYFIYDWFVRPLKLSLKLNSFYLTLSANLSLYIGWYSFLCFIPIFTKFIDKSLSINELHEPIFIISIAAFLWICFLIITPWLVELPKRHLNIIFILGTILQGVGFFVFANSANHETITFGSMIFGCGFGAASFTLITVIKECLGVQNWSLLKKTVNTFTGIIIFVFVYTIYGKLNNFNELTLYFNLIGGYEIFVSIYWTIYHLIHIKNHTHSRWNSRDSMYN